MTYEHRYYAAVTGNTTSTSDYTPANGEELSLEILGGDASQSTDVKIEITWDPAGTPELLFSTHGSNQCHTTKVFTGNGTKVLRISLVNDSDVTETIGGFVIMEKKYG